MKSRVSKSDPGEAVSLFAALVEQKAPITAKEISMGALAAIARSSKSIATQSKRGLRLPYLDPSAVSALPQGSRAFVVVATNAGDDHHHALTVGVLRPDGVRATKTLYASKKALSEALNATEKANPA